jgi:hypothetical protein
MACIAGCAVVAPVGEPRPAFGSVNGSMAMLLAAHIPQLRVAEQASAESAIPIAAAYRVRPVGGSYLCPRQQDPSCLSLAIGDALLQSPAALEKLHTVARQPCQYLPNVPPMSTDMNPGERLDKRLDRRDLLEIRTYFGCDSETKIRRNIYFYIIRDAAKAMDRSSMGQLLESHTLRSIVITVN